jgi:hypothetical protein
VFVYQSGIPKRLENKIKTPEGVIFSAEFVLSSRLFWLSDNTLISEKKRAKKA